MKQLYSRAHEALLAVIAQRRTKRICKHCRKPGFNKLGLPSASVFDVTHG